MKKPGKAWRRAVLFLALAILLTGFAYWQNNGLVTTRAVYAGAEVPPEFDGFTILQLSDLHNKRFGPAQARLLGAIREAEPDVILITGDIIDRRKYDIAPALELVSGACSIAPVYVVSGNHEAWSGRYEEISAALTAAGAVMLDDARATLRMDDASITLLGLADPAFRTDGYAQTTDLSDLRAPAAQWRDVPGFTVLLSHRPELFSSYAAANVDLVFAGHAHGGQFRLPGLGGLFAPDQGFFPAYTSGSYTMEQTTMFVSRGLGNSLFPLRLFNRPELVLVELRSE